MNRQIPMAMVSPTREVELGIDTETADTDGDGLVDGVEVNQLGPHPLASDTDCDGQADRAEVADYPEHATDAAR